MFCTNCGYELKDQFKFCPNCGTKVSQSIISDKDQEVLENVENKIETPDILLCGECEEEKRNIYRDYKFIGERVCPICEIEPGICPSCKKPLRTKNAQQCSSCGASWRIDPPKKTIYSIDKKISSSDSSNVLKCPKCSSPNTTYFKKGFSAGKAVTGAVLTGGIGIIGGFIGSNKVIITCLNCGHKWSPGSKK